jgi:hypothetical protein
MSAERPVAAWIDSPSIGSVARALLSLVDPPRQPVEFHQFLAGLREAQRALNPEGSLRFQATPLETLVDQLAIAVPSTARATRTQWDQDSLRGYGASPYRAFAQPAHRESAGGYACLKGVLLGLLLVRSRDRSAVTLESIQQVARFIRLGSRNVHVDLEVARTKVIASLPSTFVPSRLQAALMQRDGVPASLHPRLDEISRAVQSLTRSFSLLDRGDPKLQPVTESPLKDTVSKADGDSVRHDRPVRHYQTSCAGHPLDETSAGVEEPDATSLYGPAFAPSGKDREEMMAAAEALDDRAQLVDGLIQETSPSTSKIKRAETAQRLRSDVRQGFWARYQWDALSPPEMRQTLQQLLDEIVKVDVAKYAIRHEALTLDLLSGSTGLPRARCHAIRTTPPESEEKPHDLLVLHLGKLTLPLVKKEERYKPGPGQMECLRHVKDAVSICLPVEVTAALRQLTPSDDGYAFRTELADLEAILDRDFRGERIDEPRVTAARLARGHQLEVLAQCGHVPSAQIITGQTLGTPAVGLSYYTTETNRLQKIYDRAVVHHGLTPRETATSSSDLVGSKLALTDDSIGTVVQATCEGLFNQPRDKRLTGRELLRFHAELVRAVASIWMAGTGFRPTFRLGEVRSTHINWISHAATIRDKVTDAAHEGRLVPLAPTVMSALGALGAILVRMSEA